MRNGSVVVFVCGGIISCKSCWLVLYKCISGSFSNSERDLFNYTYWKFKHIGCNEQQFERLKKVIITSHTL